MAFARNRGAGPAKGTLEYFEAQSNSTRGSWFVVLALTLVNILLNTLTDADKVYLFSAWLPLQAIYEGLLAHALKDMTMATIMFAICSAFMLIGLLSAIFWNKSPFWSLLSAILYAVDCVLLATAFNDGLMTTAVLHVLILVLLINGFINNLKAHKTRKAAAQSAVPTTEPTANNYKGPEL